jgi:hypothetical protein
MATTAKKYTVMNPRHIGKDADGKPIHILRQTVAGKNIRHFEGDTVTAPGNFTAEEAPGLVERGFLKEVTSG